MQQINPADAQRIDDRDVYAPLRKPDEWPARRALAAGCDQQGRYVTRRVDTAGMGPAECCTEMGSDDEDACMPEGAGPFVWPLVSTIAIFAALLALHLWSQL